MNTRSVGFLLIAAICCGCASTLVYFGVERNHNNSDSLRECCLKNWNTTALTCEQVHKDALSEFSYGLAAILYILTISFILTWHPKTNLKKIQQILLFSLAISLALFVCWCFMFNIASIVYWTTDCENSDLSQFQMQYKNPNARGLLLTFSVINYSVDLVIAILILYGFFSCIKSVICLVFTGDETKSDSYGESELSNKTETEVSTSI